MNIPKYLQPSVGPQLPPKKSTEKTRVAKISFNHPDSGRKIIDLSFVSIMPHGWVECADMLGNRMVINSPYVIEFEPGY